MKPLKPNDKIRRLAAMALTTAFFWRDGYEEEFEACIQVLLNSARDPIALNLEPELRQFFETIELNYDLFSEIGNEKH